MVFINETGIMNTLLIEATNNLTGDIFITLLLLMIIIIAFFLMFRIPIEATAIFILPLLLTFMSYYSNFVAIGGLFLIYLAVLFAKNFFFRID